jgi:hypothetical protein
MPPRGWQVTVEAALLGLLVVASVSGTLIALAAISAFAVVTPLGILRQHGSHDPGRATTRRAVTLCTTELALIVGASSVAVLRTGGAWLIPYLWIAPLLALEVFAHTRTADDDLTTQLSRAVVGSVTVAAIVIAGGGSSALAAAAFLLLASRAATATSVLCLPPVPSDGAHRPTTAVGDVGQAVGVALAFVACLIDHRMLVGFGCLVLVVVVQFSWSRGPLLSPIVIRRWETAFGLLLVACVAGGVALL